MLGPVQAMQVVDVIREHGAIQLSGRSRLLARTLFVCKIPTAVVCAGDADPHSAGRAVLYARISRLPSGSVGIKPWSKPAEVPKGTGNFREIRSTTPVFTTFYCAADKDKD